MKNEVGQRKCEMWISNNKVLIGGGAKKPHARNPNFETEETKLLISLWGDPKVQKTLITTHKKHPVIAKLAETMREHGYHRSPEEINTRIKNLKCFYNRIKKDIEMGITTEPTWRHYTAMDDILTRPVFGNRIQQPHLVNVHKVNEDAETKDLRPEDLLSVEEEMDDSELDDGSIVPKDEPIDIDDMEEIGCDDENDRMDNEIDDVNDIFPKLSAYLQLASNSALKGAPNSSGSGKSTPPPLDIKTSPPSSPTSDSRPLTPASPRISTTSSITLSSCQPTPSIAAPSNANHSAIVSGNKISLVPTNYLMKQTVTSQAGKTQFSFKPQQFICKQTTSNGSTVLQTTSSNGMPMKVLLVNTLQKPNQSSSSSSSSSVSLAAKPIISTSIAPRSLVSIQPKPTTILTNSTIQSTYQTRSTTAANAHAVKSQPLLSSNKYLCSASSSTNNEPGVKRTTVFKQKTTPGFRTLLNQLVQLQTRQLEVSQQRLEVERERLEFERGTSDKILTALTSLLKNRTDTKNE